MDLAPRISVLLPAMKGIGSVKAALRAWSAQAHQAEIEIVIAFPDAEEAKGMEIPSNWVLVPTRGADLHVARAMALLAARGEFVVMAEDHCLPDADWSGPILERIAEGWDGIGPALRPGTRGSIWPEGCFLIGYGEWMEPVGNGPTNVLCGWNSILRRSMLLEMREQIATNFQIGAFAIQELKKKGARFYLEPEARMRHFDVPGMSFGTSLLFLVGKGFGAKRTQNAGLLARGLYPLAIPAIAALHYRRALLGYLRAGRECRLGLGALLVASPTLAIVWALGEGIGAWLGIDKVSPHLWRTEVKPVAPDAVERSDAWEKSTGYRRVTGG